MAICIEDIVARLRDIPIRASLHIPTGFPLESAEIPVGELCREAADALLLLDGHHKEAHSTKIPCNCDDGMDWSSGKAERCPNCNGSGELTLQHALERVVEQVVKGIDRYFSWRIPFPGQANVEHRVKANIVRSWVKMAIFKRGDPENAEKNPA